MSEAPSSVSLHKEKVMQDKHTPQQLGRTENLVENLKSVATSTDGHAVVAQLELALEKASPLPWSYADGRVVSAPLKAEWDAFEAEYPGGMPDEDPRWDTLPDPTVAFVTPSVTGTGRGDRDARAIVEVLNAVPALLRRLRRAENELSKTKGHLRTIRKEYADARSAMGALVESTRRGEG